MGIYLFLLFLVHMGTLYGLSNAPVLGDKWLRCIVYSPLITTATCVISFFLLTVYLEAQDSINWLGVVRDVLYATLVLSPINAYVALRTER